MRDYNFAAFIENVFSLTDFGFSSVILDAVVICSGNIHQTFQYFSRRRAQDSGDAQMYHSLNMF